MEAPERIWINRDTLRVSQSLRVGGFFDLGRPEDNSSVLYVRDDIADRCTPEERAVIDTSLRLRQAETAHWVEKEVGSDPSRTSKERGTAYIKFVNACDALLTARAKREEANTK